MVFLPQVCDSSSHMSDKCYFCCFFGWHFYLQTLISGFRSKLPHFSLNPLLRSSASRAHVSTRSKGIRDEVLNNGCVQEDEAHVPPTRLPHSPLSDVTTAPVVSSVLTHSCDCVFFRAFVKCTFLCHSGILADPFFFIFFDENIQFACEKTYFPIKP